MLPIITAHFRKHLPFVNFISEKKYNKKNGNYDSEHLGNIGVKQHISNILLITINLTVFNGIEVAPEIISKQLKHYKCEY